MKSALTTLLLAAAVVPGFATAQENSNIVATESGGVRAIHVEGIVNAPVTEV